MAAKKRENGLSEKPQYIVVERSLLNQVVLVATCTTAMILNVSTYTYPVRCFSHNFLYNHRLVAHLRPP